MSTPPCNKLFSSSKISFLINTESCSKTLKTLEVFPWIWKVPHHFSLGLISFYCLKYVTTSSFLLFTLNVNFFWFTNTTAISGPDSLYFVQLLINLRIQADILKVLCESGLCSIKQKSSWISVVVKTIDLCSFKILNSFSDSTDGFLFVCIGQFSLTYNQERPLHQIWKSLVCKLSLLSNSAGCALVEAYC